MRESNFAFPAQNRACVCISSQLYDRRALDTSSPLPLFNSLSHLTYLTSTSPRIREILTCDGGLERLVRILRDFCAAPPPPENAQVFYGLAPPVPYNPVLVNHNAGTHHPLGVGASVGASTSTASLQQTASGSSGVPSEITRSASASGFERGQGHGHGSALVPASTVGSSTVGGAGGRGDRVPFDRGAAYRFSLAFQCVANIGVRGSEPIRSRVVQAGTLDVVGCVLESWLKTKGFAVMPSSSASGVPRETKEQRLARRQAQQAHELARALELAQQEQTRGSERSRLVSMMNEYVAQVNHTAQRAGLATESLVPAQMLPLLRHQQQQAQLRQAQQQQQATGNRGALFQQTIEQPTPTTGTSPALVIPPYNPRTRVQLQMVREPTPTNQVQAPAEVPSRPTSASPRPASAASSLAEGLASSNLASTSASASASDEEMADERERERERYHPHPSSSSSSAVARPGVVHRSTTSSAASPETSAAPTPTGPPRDRSGTVVAPLGGRRRARTVTQRDATDTEDDGEMGVGVNVAGVGVGVGATPGGRVGIVGGEDGMGVGVTMGDGMLLGGMDETLPGALQLQMQNDDLAMGAPPGAPGATPATAIPHVHDDADDSASNMADADNEADGDAMDVDVATVVGAAQAGDGTEETPRVEATPRVRNAGLPPLAQLTILNVPPAQQTPMVRTSTRSSTGGGGRMSDEGPYREEDVLIALQLLAYLSKYPHVRQAFYKKRGDVGTAASTSKTTEQQQTESGPVHHRESSLSGFARSLVGATRQTPAPTPAASTVPPAPANVIPNAAPLYPRPSMSQAPNIFSLVERFTFRPSATEASLPHPPEFLPPEIQYWAGVIMRNACRKDDSRGGIRQCANMLCGKWEESPRQFAKCRRCRKAKYCGKECQSRAWAEGHRFWCSAREEEDAGATAAAAAAAALAASGDGPAPAPAPAPGPGVTTAGTDAAVAAAAALNPAAAGAAAAGPTITGMGRHTMATQATARPTRPLRAGGQLRDFTDQLRPIQQANFPEPTPLPTRVRREIMRAAQALGTPIPAPAMTAVQRVAQAGPARVPAPSLEGVAGRRRAETVGSSPVASTSRTIGHASPSPPPDSASPAPSPAPSGSAGTPGPDDMVLS